MGRSVKSIRRDYVSVRVKNPMDGAGGEYNGAHDGSEDRLDQDHVQDRPGTDTEEYVPLPEVQDDNGQSGDEFRDTIGVG